MSLLSESLKTNVSHLPLLTDQILLLTPLQYVLRTACDALILFLMLICPLMSV